MKLDKNYKKDLETNTNNIIDLICGNSIKKINVENNNNNNNN